MKLRSERKKLRRRRRSCGKSYKRKWKSTHNPNQYPSNSAPPPSIPVLLPCFARPSVVVPKIQCPKHSTMAATASAAAAVHRVSKGCSPAYTTRGPPLGCGMVTAAPTPTGATRATSQL